MIGFFDKFLIPNSSFLIPKYCYQSNFMEL